VSGGFWLVELDMPTSRGTPFAAVDYPRRAG